MPGRRGLNYDKNLAKRQRAEPSMRHRFPKTRCFSCGAALGRDPMPVGDKMICNYCNDRLTKQGFIQLNDGQRLYRDGVIKPEHYVVHDIITGRAQNMDEAAKFSADYLGTWIGYMQAQFKQDPEGYARGIWAGMDKERLAQNQEWVSYMEDPKLRQGFKDEMKIQIDKMWPSTDKESVRVKNLIVWAYTDFSHDVFKVWEKMQNGR